MDGTSVAPAALPGAATALPASHAAPTTNRLVLPGAQLAAAPVGHQLSGDLGHLPIPVGPVAPSQRRIGETGISVLPMALGGNVFGWTLDAGQSESVLDAFSAAGGSFLDTADSYAGGRSEIIIGNWMRRRRNRDEMVVGTKIGKSADNPGLSRRSIRAAVRASLARLQTDRIDVLYLHFDDAETSLEETLTAVDEAIRDGLVREAGFSNHAAYRVMEARILAGLLGTRPLAALQNQYSLMERTGYEGDLAGVARAQSLAVMPRFALASGFLTGKYRSRADLGGHRRGGEASKYLGKRGLRVLAALDRVAAEHGVAVGAVAIAWLLAKPLVVAPVASASTPEQLAELLAGPGVQLSRQQVALLDRASTGA